MKYTNIEKAKFESRPNRFIANVSVRGKIEVCHVKNTGRCKELLIPGVDVYVQRNDNPDRKTALDLITVRKGKTLINMDSQIPNKVVEEWIRAGNLFERITLIKPETKYKNSRFDLYIEANGERIYMEVKGVTLEENSTARFPDAPTERGLKHIMELCEAVDDGYKAFIFFVIQMKGVTHFMPNDRTHKAFGDALRMADKKGVRILAYDCLVTKDSIVIDKMVPVRL